MSTKPSVIELLAQTTPVTTEAESAHMLASIETAVSPSVWSVPSPFYRYYFSFKPLSYIALTLVLALGATGTVAASGSAKPGDFLFPLKRVTEETRVALANDTEKEALKNQFIGERFAELHEIVVEETVATTTSSTTLGVFVRAEGESRVANAVAVLANQLVHESDSPAREQFLRDLLAEVDTLRVAGRDNAPLSLDEFRVRIDDNRSELRTAKERIKIEKKDDQIEIKYENHGYDNEESDNVSNKGASAGLKDNDEGSTDDDVDEVASKAEDETFDDDSSADVEVQAPFEAERDTESDGHHDGDMNDDSENGHHDSEDEFDE